jgi:hypothetical protein
MKFSKYTWIAALMLVLSAALGLGLIAAEDAPEPNTPEDNACYEGGVMAGKCDTEWAWKGGWYLARFLTDDLTREQVPDEFQILLPPPVEAPPLMTLCKVLGRSGKVCLNSNQTGMVDEVGMYHSEGPEAYYIFTTDPAGANCPARFNGFPLRASGGNTASLATRYGFTQAEVSSLGLHGYFCAYLID